ncbi:MAG TPA: DNA-directed RNA polymerase subunit omega [bacterium]
MINTLPLNELEKYTDNIYEAIIVLAKRARQINNEQKQSLVNENGEEYEEFDEDDVGEIEMTKADYVPLPKPTTLALNELLSGKIKFEYYEEEQPDDEEKEG